jgi:nicotinamide mononucleotide adenylyltransferase
LIVGITNPDPWQTAAEPTDPRRGTSESNPFTFYERYLMVDAALRENDVRDFHIVPFPHGFPERLHHYVPADALYLFTIYDAWGEEKLRRLSELGWRTEVLWRRTAKVTSGTELRRRMRDGDDWEHLVPAGTADVIRKLGLPDRLREA